MQKNKTTNTPKAKSKPRAESIKLNLTPEQAVGEIIKGCIENGFREIWSLYPFKEGEISSYYAPGQQPKYGATESITPEQQRDIEKILGPLTLPKLRVFLTENFNIADLNCLTWDELLLYFQRFARQNQKTKSTSKEQKQALAGEWSKPMTKSAMKNALRIDGYRTFDTFAEQHGIKKIGRQLWQIRLDAMDKTTRKKLENI